MYKIIGADGKEYGPVSADQLREWIAQGRANAQTRAAAEGMTEWRPLGAFPEFSTLLAAAGPTAASPAPPAPGILAASPVRGTNGFAVASMVLGILALVVLCCCYGLPFNVLGLVFSIIALVQIRGEPELYDGAGMAIAGLVLSVLSILLGFGLYLLRYSLPLL